MEFRDVPLEAWAGGALALAVLLVVVPRFLRWQKRNRAINSALDGNGAYGESSSGLQVFQRRGGQIVTTPAE